MSFDQNGRTGGHTRGGGVITISAAAPAVPIDQLTSSISTGSQTSTTSSSSSVSTKSTSSNTSNTSNSGSLGSNKGPLIGGVIGGLFALLLLALLGIWLLQRRKKRRSSEESETSQPITYTGLIANHEPYDPVPAPPAIFGYNREMSYSGVDMRGGAGSLNENPFSRASAEINEERPLPTYAQSQFHASVREGATITPITPFNAREAFMTTQRQGPAELSSHHRIPTLTSQFTSDTMGFPTDDNAVTSVPSREITPLPAPVPRNSAGRTADQELFAGWDSMSRNESVSAVSPIESGERESVRRMNTQNTVNSINSTVPSLISDEELERLGVGIRRIDT